MTKTQSTAVKNTNQNSNEHLIHNCANLIADLDTIETESTLFMRKLSTMNGAASFSSNTLYATRQSFINLKRMCHELQEKLDILTISFRRMAMHDKDRMIAIFTAYQETLIELDILKEMNRRVRQRFIQFC